MQTVLVKLPDDVYAEFDRWAKDAKIKTPHLLSLVLGYALVQKAERMKTTKDAIINFGIGKLDE